MKLKSFSIIFIIVMIIPMFLIETSADDGLLSQEDKTNFDVGDKYQFKYEILRKNDKKDNINMTYNIDNSSLTIVEGDILDLEVIFISVPRVLFWMSVNGSEQDKIEIVSIITSNSLFFVMNNSEYYQNLVIGYQYEDENNPNYKSVKAFIKNDRFYYKKIYEDNLSLEFIESEIVISKGISSSFTLKYSKNYSKYDNLTYDYYKIVSLDYPSEYSGKNNFDLINILRENLVNLVTNPFFYVVITELVGLLFLIIVIYNKKRKKF